MFVCTRRKVSPRVHRCIDAASLRRYVATAALLVLTGCLDPKHLRTQTNGIVAGRFLDARNDAPIAAAHITEISTRTDAIAGPQGGFQLELPAGKHHLLVHADGYADAFLNVDVVARTTILATKDGYVRLNSFMKH